MHDDHAHSHTHDHDDRHYHDHGQADDAAKIRALLEYMLEHNRSHVAELAGVAHKLGHANQEKAAGMVLAGVKDFEAGNAKLEAALKLLDGENG
jgi:hypothetical protein